MVQQNSKDPAAYKEYLKSLDVRELRERGLTVPELFTPFSDVPTSHSYYKAILWAQQKGLSH